MVRHGGGDGNGWTMTYSRRVNARVRVALAAALLAGASALFASRVLAQDARSAARAACMADYSRYCSGIAPGGGRVRKCLSDNYSGLSQACKQALDANPPK